MMKDCSTKYRIMEVALDLIWRSSYDAVGVAEICQKAKVNKGSFYHFFPSKEALAVAALEKYWQRIQPGLDQIFSPQKNPVQRILDYCDHGLKMQREKKECCGIVCGCPYTTVGIEQGCQNRKIGEVAGKMMERIKKYFVSAIKEAAAEGLIEASDPIKKANQLYTFYLGALTQARIYNDLSLLEGLKQQVKEFLGVSRQPAKV